MITLNQASYALRVDTFTTGRGECGGYAAYLYLRNRPLADVVVDQKVSFALEPLIDWARELAEKNGGAIEEVFGL